MQYIYIYIENWEEFPLKIRFSKETGKTFTPVVSGPIRGIGDRKLEWALRCGIIRGSGHFAHAIFPIHDKIEKGFEQKRGNSKWEAECTRSNTNFRIFLFFFFFSRSNLSIHCRNVKPREIIVSEKLSYFIKLIVT